MVVTVKHFRLDDRLVHGQIVTAWLSSTNCNTIVVADDKAAGDSLSKTLFRMAVPSSVKLLVETVDNVCSYLLEETTDEVLLICRNLGVAQQIFEKVPVLNSLNIGNISNKSESKQYSKSVWLSLQDLEIISELKRQNKELYVQVVPSEKRRDIN